MKNTHILDLRLIDKLINKLYSKKTETTKQTIKRCKEYVRLIQKQIKDGKLRLYLEDSFIAEALNCTKHQAKHVKNILSKLEIIYVKKGTHPKGPNQAAIWLANFKYCKKSTNVDTKPKKPRTQRTFYKPAYHKTYNYCKNLINYFNKDQRIPLSGKYYFITLHSLINAELKNQGLTREMLKI